MNRGGNFISVDSIRRGLDVRAYVMGFLLPAVNIDVEGGYGFLIRKVTRIDMSEKLKHEAHEHTTPISSTMQLCSLVQGNDDVDYDELQNLASGPKERTKAKNQARKAHHLKEAANPYV